LKILFFFSFPAVINLFNISFIFLISLSKKPEQLELLITIFKCENFFDVRYKQANEKEQQQEVKGVFAELLVYSPTLI
jgi:hypothetical protein